MIHDSFNFNQLSGLYLDNSKTTLEANNRLRSLIVSLLSCFFSFRWSALDAAGNFNNYDQSHDIYFISLQRIKTKNGMNVHVNKTVSWALGGLLFLSAKEVLCFGAFQI